MEDAIRIIKYDSHGLAEADDLVVCEQKVDLYVNGTLYISLLCLPQNLDALAVGFVYAEGLIQSREDILRLDVAGLDRVNIDIRRESEVDRAEARVLSSGFAKGSVRQSFLDITLTPQVSGTLQIPGQDIVAMAANFSRRSVLFQRTGAVHSSALCLPDGTDLFFEDIGRHNAIDKIVGQAILSALAMENGILLTSGRISAEMLLKTAGLGIPILVSMSAPTNMAVDIAGKIGMTLIGFARGDRFNIYAGASRILSTD